MRKVFIRFGLGLDFGFRVIIEVLILLGFVVDDLGKVFISNKKASEGGFSQRLRFVFLTCFNY